MIEIISNVYITFYIIFFNEKMIRYLEIQELNPMQIQLLNFFIFEFTKDSNPVI